jgi:hypothetical protein
MKFVGFWKRIKEKNENDMPWETPWFDMPIADSAAEDQTYLLQLLDKKEKSATKRCYFGVSTCRICNCSNGSSEYSIDGFTWPCGYKHYLEAHNVACDNDFKQYLVHSDRGSNTVPVDISVSKRTLRREDVPGNVSQHCRPCRYNTVLLQGEEHK